MPIVPGYPPRHRPEEMCKVLIAGSDEQVASARRDEKPVFRCKRILTHFSFRKKSGILMFFTDFHFQNSRKRAIFYTFLHFLSFQHSKKPENPSFLMPTWRNICLEPADAVSMQGAGGIPGGRGAADYGVAQVWSLKVGDVVWLEDLLFF